MNELESSLSTTLRYSFPLDKHLVSFVKGIKHDYFHLTSFSWQIYQESLGLLLCCHLKQIEEGHFSYHPLVIAWHIQQYSTSSSLSLENLNVIKEAFISEQTILSFSLWLIIFFRMEVLTLIYGVELIKFL